MPTRSTPKSPSRTASAPATRRPARPARSARRPEGEPEPTFQHAAEAVMATAESTSGTLLSVGRAVAAVEEVAERARHAPARILADLKAAGEAGMQGARKAAVLYAIAGGLALLALAALTVGAAVVLDILLGGSPRGAFVIAGLYGIGAVVAAVKARKAIRRGRREAMEKVADIRAAALDVARPVQRELDRRQRRSRARRVAALAAASPSTR